MCFTGGIAVNDFIKKLTSENWIWPEKEILVEGENRFTERQFVDAVRYARTAYMEQGIKDGERILLMIPAGSLLYVTLYALWSLGAAGVLFDSDMDMPTRKLCMERAKVKKIIGVDRIIEQVKKYMGDEVTILSCESCVCFGKKGTAALGVTISPEKEALISFTSGSTGVPKGIVRSFGFLECQREEIRKRFLYEEQDVDFAVMPIFTVTNFIFGIKTVLPPFSLRETECAPSIFENVQKEQVTRMILSPFLAEAMIRYGKQNKIRLSSVRKVFVGGGPTYKHIIKGVMELFPMAECYLLYGCSEAEPIALYNMKRLTEEQWKSIESGEGLVAGEICLPCTIIKNEPDRQYGEVDEKTWESLKLTNEVGEIVVSGKHVLSGYIDGIGDAENKIRVGDTVWHRTGDLGRIKEDGVLYLYGRTKAAFQEKGRWFYPFCVESKVYANFQVEKVAFLLHKGKKTLVVQAGKAECKKIAEQKEWLGVDEVICIDKMPMDKKHLSKVDYGTLNSLI